MEALAAGRDPATGQPFGGDVRAIFDTFLRRNVPARARCTLTFVDGAVHSSPAPCASTESPSWRRSGAR